MATRPSVVRLQPYRRPADGLTATRRRSGGVSWLLLMLAWLPALVAAQTRAPYIPAGPQVVLQQVPPTTDPRVRRFDALRADLARHPHDAQRAVALAQAYVDYARATGDARFLGRAMAVIEPWMRAPAPPISIALLHATVQQSRHFFSESRKELGEILARDPDSAQAWLTLATVAMVQGDMDGANRACVKLANTGGDFMGMVCTASLRMLTGKAKQAYALLTLVEDPGPKAPPAIKAWIEGLMADTAIRLDQPQLADQHFRQALQWTPGDNFLLADYADFLLDQQRPREALALLDGDSASDTSFLRQVYAETALGLPQAKSDAEAMAARFAAMDARGSHVFQREQAGFALHVQHDPTRALALAQQNWTVQRAPQDVRIYLEAALAAHEPAAAQPVLEFVQRTQLRDPTIDALVAKLRSGAEVAQAASGRPQ